MQNQCVWWYLHVSYKNKSTMSDGMRMWTTTTRALCLMVCAYKLQQQEHYVWLYVHVNCKNKSTVADDACVQITITKSAAKAPQQDPQWTWWHWGSCAGPPLGPLHPLPEPQKKRKSSMTCMTGPTIDAHEHTPFNLTCLCYNERQEMLAFQIHTRALLCQNRRNAESESWHWSW